MYQLSKAEPVPPVDVAENKYSFTVDGVLVQVTGTIQSVNITKNGIEVKF